MVALNRPFRLPSASGLATRPVSVLLLLAAVAALSYANTFHASFQFDDIGNIVNNPQIRSLAALRDLSGTRAVGVLTFAVNYAAGGLNPVGYHVVNLFIHIINGILVYTLVGLLFRTPRMQAGRGSDPALPVNGIAVITALLFVAHPLQTQAVTYIVQRYTSLAALFYLLAVVGYLKWRLAATDTRARYGWYAAAVVATVLAMKTKEHTVTLPLMLLLLEGVGFGLRPWGKWWPLLPFVLLLPLIPLSLPHGLWLVDGDVSLARETTAIGRLSYLATQCRVLVTYLRLMVWPVGQNVDYDYALSNSLLEPAVIASGLFLAGMLGLAHFLVVASGRWRLVGLGGLWFFLTVSVESSIIPITDVIFEHRMYLPSVGVLLAGSVLAGTLLARWRVIPVIAFGMLVALLAGATYERNKIWADEVTLWRDVVAKSPKKARGHMNLGLAHVQENHWAAAIDAYQTALQLRPDYAEAHMNLGVMYAQQGKVEAAIQAYQTALRLQPDYAEAHMNLGIAYAVRGRGEAAIQEHRRSIELKPAYAEAHYNLGVSYAAQGQGEAAIQAYQRAIELKPELPDFHYNLGVSYAAQGQGEAAIRAYQSAIELKPDFPEPHNNLGSAYLRQGRLEEASAAFQTALRLRPTYVEAYYNLGIVRSRQGRLDEAIAAFLASVRLKPNLAEAEAKLGAAYAQQGRWAEAVAHYQRALQLRSEWVDVRFQLGQVYLHTGRTLDARREFEAVVRLRPEFAPAQQALRQLDGRP